MLFDDRIYGKVQVSSPAIAALVNGPSMQRLKGIAQFGVPDQHYYRDGYSRYEHSVGVMLLLKRLGASEEEQIAGLLHDVSHTAFSHVADWVLDDRKAQGYQDSFQDSQHEFIISRSEIPAILQKYDYDPQRIINFHHHFGLLERDLPDLCADRVDYTLRELPASAVKICLPQLTTRDGKIVFKNKSPAQLFAKHYLKCQERDWGGFEPASRYHIFADVLKQALDNRIITQEDFWQDDNYIMTKLYAATNADIHRMLDMLRDRSLSHIPKSDVKVYTKFRRVDPLYINGQKLSRLSQTDKSFALQLEKARQANQLGMYLPKYK